MAEARSPGATSEEVGEEKITTRRLAAGVVAGAVDHKLRSLPRIQGGYKLHNPFSATTRLAASLKFIAHIVIGHPEVALSSIILP